MKTLAMVAIALAVPAAVGAAWILLFDGDDRLVEHAGGAESPVDRPIVQPTPLNERTVAIDDPVLAEKQSRVAAPITDWTRSYHDSTDHFSLAREMAAAALLGDARAEYRLGNLLLRCEVYKRILSDAQGSVSERVEFHLASGNLPEHARREFRRGALRCGKLFTEDPFAGYDLPEEARDFRYWADKAVESGDPLAVVTRAFRAATDHQASDDADKERAFREALLSDVRRVVFSADGAALYVLGGMLSHPSIVTDPEDGYAWTVAACESGYDCSNGNPDVGAGCIERGTCEPGHTFLDVVQRDLGAGKYAAIYAKAQDIQYKIRTNDWDGLQQYLQLKE